MPRTSYLNSLYSDQLDAVSFLYGQRQALFASHEVSWQEIGKFEARLEANFDALVEGGEPALEVCCRQAREGDAGELFAAVSVFCRLGRRDLFIKALVQLDPDDKEKLGALTDALKYELPADWQDDFVSLLQTDDEQLCALVATVVGYRRVPAGDKLVEALWNFQPAPLIRAVGRLRERGAINQVLPLLRSDDEDVSAAAALALLRLGVRQAVDFCREVGGEKGWATIPLALGGGRSDLSLLLDVARPDEATADAVLALGILGESSAVPVLLEKLAGEQAAAAALALNLLTGAELSERLFIPDEVNEDELFPEELEAFRTEGKVPTKPDGTPYGVWVNRLSQSSEAWSQWWGQNSYLFQPEVRYRNGAPFSPYSLIENLRQEKSPHRIRQLAYDELVIRYDIDFPFEAEYLVSDQVRVLAQMAQWATANAGKFRTGVWYFAGELHTDRFLRDSRSIVSVQGTKSVEQVR